MQKFHQIAFLFPGQGAQYSGMGRDFAEHYSQAREVFEEADDLLHQRLSHLMFQGSIEELTETKNSQLAIFVMSIALLRTLQSVFPELKCQVCAGLSLGEYSALVAAGKLSFEEALTLVSYRSQYMNEACEERKGGMAVVMGLEAAVVEGLVNELNMPNDLWCANFNCPGQVVISGTLRGIEEGSAAAKAKGAKRVLPLQVHGAFHSGLMKSAEKRLAEHIEQASFQKGGAHLVMNVPGDFVDDESQMRHCLIKQVTSPVKWESGVRAMGQRGVDLFVEIGPGKTLKGMNTKIGMTAPTTNLEKVEEIATLEQLLI